MAVINNVNRGNPYLNRLIDSNCIFIHIPKTAGLSVKRSLLDVGGTYHYSFRNYENIFNQKFIKKAYKFTFVRHPLSRAFSAYNFLKSEGKNSIDKAFSESYVKPYMDFNDFVNRGLSKNKEIQRFIHFKSQTSFLINHQGLITLDFIGKLENIQDDYRTVATKLKVHNELNFVNKTDRKEVSENITEETIMNVFSIYEDDFYVFNYSWNKFIL